MNDSDDGDAMRRSELFLRILFVIATGVLSGPCFVAVGQTANITSGSTSIPAVCLSIVVPSYFYPLAGGSAWDAVIAQPLHSTQAERIMIANPNSGPGKSEITQFREAISRAQRSGNKVYGYVSTRYGKVDARTVQQEVGKYIQWYGVDGIFVDEVSADAKEVARYYQPLATFITSAIKGGGVILNAGTYPDARYAAINVPEKSKLQIVVFEREYASFRDASFVVPAWIRKYPASMFISIVYDTPAKDVSEVLQLSAERGASTVYVTDQSMPNPYAGLPSYWVALDRDVQAGCAR